MIKRDLLNKSKSKSLKMARNSMNKRRNSKKNSNNLMKKFNSNLARAKNYLLKLRMTKNLFKNRELMSLISRLLDKLLKKT